MRGRTIRERARLLWFFLPLALAGAGPAVAAGKGLEIYWVDVEGGAATLIVTPAGESLLVDSGWPGERDPQRIAKLAREIAGINRIDHMITSHWHTDHFGGVAHLADLVPLGKFYDHGFPPLPAGDIPAELVEPYRRVTGGHSVVLRPGDEIKLAQAPGAPRLDCKILASGGIVAGERAGAGEIRACTANPKHEAHPADTSDNARSLAFVLGFGDWRFFDAGDLTWNVEHKLVCPKNLVGRVTVYQVTHHGIDQSNNPALIQAVQPRVAVMNNGARKGGMPPAVRTLKATPSLQALFALHRNVQTGPEDNAAPERTANDAENCQGNYVKLAVAPDAKSFTVSVPSKGTTRSFTTR